MPLRAELERDIAAEELQRSLRETGAAMREAQAALRAEADGLMRGPAPARDAAHAAPVQPDLALPEARPADAGADADDAGRPDGRH